MDHSRKRRKWDVAAPGVVSGTSATNVHAQQANAITTTVTGFSGVSRPFASVNPGQALSQDVIERAKQGAAAAVERLNLGLLKHGGSSHTKSLVYKAEDEKKELVEEVIINDAPSHIRFNLTKRATQDDIQRLTHTVIVTRGRYFPPGVSRDSVEKPLHLRITPGSGCATDVQRHQAVQAAVDQVNRIIRGQPFQSTTSSSFVVQGESAVHSSMPTQTLQQSSYVAVVYVGFQAPPEFNLCERLQGPGGSYLQHIASETGTTVALSGDGTGCGASVEALHVRITSSNPASLHDAERLAKNLIDTVRGELCQQPIVQSSYSAAGYQYAAPPGPVCQPASQTPGPFGTPSMYPAYALPHSHRVVPQYLGPPQSMYQPPPRAYAPQLYARVPMAYQQGMANQQGTLDPVLTQYKPQLQTATPAEVSSTTSGNSVTSTEYSQQLNSQDPNVKRRRFTEFKPPSQDLHAQGQGEQSPDAYGVQTTALYPQPQPGYPMAVHAAQGPQQGVVKVYATGGLVDYVGDD